MFLLLVSGQSLSESAANEVTRADEIKAAFIYNFAKFVEWPVDAFKTDDEPLTLCALDGSVEQRQLALIDGRVAQGRVIAQRVVDTPEQANRCHILYLPPDTTSYASALSSFVAHSVLTISENTQFVDQGGIVSLFIDGDHVRFRINLKVAQESRLKVSARMLQLAQEVR
ncbi:MAG: YfiR family protein [Alcanivoracaceae bacterium]|nr:YfiR family protein [Alcanivoracaceae bacterium]